MHIFYAPESSGNTITLSETESRHCIRVLRMTTGCVIKLIDGSGNLYTGYISDPDPLRCKIIVTKTITGFGKRNYRLHIGISPIKNRERFEWFLEKSVEIGIDIITPLICHRSEKNPINESRAGNIIISAIKQSVKAYKPELTKPYLFDEFTDTFNSGVCMITHCSKAFERNKIDSVYSRGRNAVILIGPEGDFTDEEIIRAIERGYIPVHLGESRLRTETAGIAACHSVYFINQ